MGEQTTPTYLSRDRGRPARTAALALGLACAWEAPALACGPLQPTPTVALPAAGATEVPAGAAILLVTGASTPPQGLSLEADGRALPTPALEPIGAGLALESWTAARYFRLVTALAPGTTYVLRAAGQELTRFSTASAASAPAGTPPRIDRLRLWRMHHQNVSPPSCIWSEHEGYVDVEHTPGAVAGTPPAELVRVLTLTPEGGGPSQSFVFSRGERFPSPLIDPAPVPTTTPPVALSPGTAWKPQLEADRVYCATLTVIGRNDHVRAPLVSNTLCAPVTSVEEGRPAAGTPDGGGGGCAVGAGGTVVGGLLPLLLAAALRPWRQRSRRA